MARITEIRVPSLFLAALLLLLNSCTKAPEPGETTLYAVGDVMLGRYIAKVMNARGTDYPFGQIAESLHKADIVFGNLESVMSSDEISAVYPEKLYSFHASRDAAHALKKAGFHILSLANNHAMDYGPQPLAETQRLLADFGIRTFGSGTNISQARQPAIVVKKNIRFGFLGYGVGHSRVVYAGKSRPGVAPLDMEGIRKDLLALRAKVDVLVVSLHWGIEYENIPSRIQRKEAHQIIDWGADLILGHHPHVMQGIEIYKGKIIAYSLGNFIFDQKGNGTDRSFILACRFKDKTLYSTEIIPLDRFKSYFPRKAQGDAKKDILAKVKQYSLPINPDQLDMGRVERIAGSHDLPQDE